MEAKNTLAYCSNKVLWHCAHFEAKSIRKIPIFLIYLDVLFFCSLAFFYGYFNVIELKQILSCLQANKEPFTRAMFAAKNASCQFLVVPYFVGCSAHMSIVCNLILQFYLKGLFIYKVGGCYLPSKVHRQYFSIIFNEKKWAVYSIKYSICFIGL